MKIKRVRGNKVETGEEARSLGGQMTMNLGERLNERAVSVVGARDVAGGASRPSVDVQIGMKETPGFQV